MALSRSSRSRRPARQPPSASSGSVPHTPAVSPAPAAAAAVTRVHATGRRRPGGRLPRVGRVLFRLRGPLVAGARQLIPTAPGRRIPRCTRPAPPRPGGQHMRRLALVAIVALPGQPRTAEQIEIHVALSGDNANHGWGSSVQRRVPRAAGVVSLPCRQRGSATAGGTSGRGRRAGRIRPGRGKSTLASLAREGQCRDHQMFRGGWMV